MARSIVLRFEATCFDCGRSLPAGSTARWFGKGRVSCCGARADAATGAPPVAFPRTPSPVAQPLPAPLPLAGESDIDRALLLGLNPSQLPIVAARTPSLLLLVRLQSGARFLVPAQHAEQVIRCVSESMIDRVRDVTRATSQVAS